MNQPDNREFRQIRQAESLGFTLVELLVAMGIGLFLTAGILSLFLGTKQSYNTNEALAEVQEEGRFVLEDIAQELRQSGSLGCQRTLMLQQPLPPAGTSERLMHESLLLRNTLALVSPVDSDPDTTTEALNWWVYGFNNQAPLEGFDGTGSSFAANKTPDFFPSASSLLAGLGMAEADNTQDVVVSRRVIGPPMPVIDHPAKESSLVILESTLGIGDIAIATTCEHATIFQVTDVHPDTPCDGLSTIDFEALASSDPNFAPPGNQDYGTTGNVSLGWRYANNPASVCPVPTSGTDLQTYLSSTIGAVFRLQVKTYYIRPNADNIPTLWVKTNLDNSEPLIEGIYGLQLLYGTNRLAASCGGADDPDISDYAVADSVSNWNEVNAVKLGVVVGSSQGSARAVVDEPVTLPFRSQADGSGVFDAASLATEESRRYFQVFSSTVFLRNKIPCLGLDQWTAPLGSEL